MREGPHNENVPPREYRYNITINNGTIHAERGDETLTIGTTADLKSFFSKNEPGKNETVELPGPMGCAVDIVQLTEEMTVPRTFGDEIRNIPPDETGGRGFPERLRTFAALVYVHTKYGFERRENHNHL